MVIDCICGFGDSCIADTVDSFHESNNNNGFCFVECYEKKGILLGELCGLDVQLVFHYARIVCVDCCYASKADEGN